MKINWNIKQMPKPACVVSCYRHGDKQRMKKNIEANGSVNISVRQRTKTSLEISMWYDDDSFTVAHVPVGAEHLKFVESYFDGVFSSGMRYSFRISKKQGMNELKEYLGLVLGEMNFSLDVLNVNMNIIGVEALAA